jgi:hypothetical protein
MDLNDYLIVHILGKIQIHHKNCHLSNTLVTEWTEKRPGAMAFKTVIDLIEAHEEKFHKS